MKSTILLAFLLLCTALVCVFIKRAMDNPWEAELEQRDRDARQAAEAYKQNVENEKFEADLRVYRARRAEQASRN